jgi:phosphoglycolate phosphatase
MKNGIVRGILFDLDGVLIDSGRDIMHAVNWTLGQFGFPALPYEIVKGHVGYGATELLTRCFGEFGPGHREAAAEALPVYKARYLEHSVVETTLYPGVEEGLNLLSGLAMAVVTNKPGALADLILTRFGIRKHFGSLVSPEVLTRMKPDPEGLLLAMGELGIEAGGTIMAGDSWSDIEAGRRAGVRTIGALWGLGEAQALKNAKPDWLAGTFPEMVEIVLGD